MLGVHLDSRLTFQHHVKQVEAKAKQKINLLKCLNKSTWGAGPATARLAYTSTLLPLITYGAAVWYKGEKKIEGKLASIQRNAAIQISGAFRTTQGAALEVDLHLPAMNFTLDKMGWDSVARMASRVHSRQMVLQADTEARYKSPLARQVGRLKKELDEDDILSLLDINTAFVNEPWGLVPTTHLLVGDDPAKEAHDEIVKDQHIIKIYTDGSGIDGRIGAAAVVKWEDGETQTQKAYLGPASKYSVFCGEAKGLEMAIEAVATTDRDTLKPVHIFVDNRGLVEAITNPTAQNGQKFIKSFHALHRLVLNPVHIHWIPSHTDIPGNDEADIAAKEVTGWRKKENECGPPETDPTPGHTRTAVVRKIKDKSFTKWWKQWNKLPRKSMHRVQSTPDIRTREKYKDLTRPLASILIQARTGHIGLGKFLHAIKKLDHPRCRLCNNNQDQTPAHILLNCSALDDDRIKMWESIGKKISDLRKLTGNPAMARHAALLLLRARVLQQFRHVDVEEQLKAVRDLDEAQRQREEAAREKAKSKLVTM